MDFSTEGFIEVGFTLTWLSFFTVIIWIFENRTVSLRTFCTKTKENFQIKISRPWPGLSLPPDRGCCSQTAVNYSGWVRSLVVLWCKGTRDSQTKVQSRISPWKPECNFKGLQVQHRRRPKFWGHDVNQARGFAGTQEKKKNDHAAQRNGATTLL